MYEMGLEEVSYSSLIADVNVIRHDITCVEIYSPESVVLDC